MSRRKISAKKNTGVLLEHLKAKKRKKRKNTSVDKTTGVPTRTNGYQKKVKKCNCTNKKTRVRYRTQKS